MGSFILGLMMLAIMSIIALGWIVLLVIGIVLLRRRASGGLALTIAGGVWGVLAIGLGVAAFFGARAFTREFQVAEFDPATHQGELGALRLTYTGDSHLTLRDDEDQLLKVRAQGGEAPAPAGKFSVWRWEASARGDDGVGWTAVCYPSPGRPLRLSVSAAAASELDLGPPFTAEVVVTSEKRDRVDLDLRVIGAGGYEYTLTCTRGAPRFEALDRAGNVVWSGKFEYG